MSTGCEMREEELAWGGVSRYIYCDPCAAWRLLEGAMDSCIGEIGTAEKFARDMTGGSQPRPKRSLRRCIILSHLSNLRPPRTTARRPTHTLTRTLRAYSAGCCTALLAGHLSTAACQYTRSAGGPPRPPRSIAQSRQASIWGEWKSICRLDVVSQNR